MYGTPNFFNDMYVKSFYLVAPPRCALDGAVLAARASRSLALRAPDASATTVVGTASARGRSACLIETAAYPTRV